MKRNMFVLVFAGLLLNLVAACGGSSGVPNLPVNPVQVGGQPATLADVPVYSGATLLQPGQNPMADTLVKNVQQNASLGQKLDQKVYSLPKDANWDDMKKFYSDKLTSAGWQSLNVPIPDTDMIKSVIWRKGSQSLTVMQLTDPTSGDKFLLFSLAG